MAWLCSTYQWVFVYCWSLFLASLPISETVISFVLCTVNIVTLILHLGTKQKFPHQVLSYAEEIELVKQNTIYMVTVAFEGMIFGVACCNKIDNFLCRSFLDCTWQ